MKVKCDHRSKFSNFSNWKEASHRYREGHGFESRWSPDFFHSSFQLLKSENLLRWSHFAFISQHCWVQHVACVWPPCCDVLRHVENGQIFHATFVDVAWRCSRLDRFVQQSGAWACALVWFLTPNISQHIATGWPNACNMLRPTMLRSVGPDAFKCCDRLAGTCKCWANNVGICCVEMIPSFRRGIAHSYCALFLRHQQAHISARAYKT